MKRFLLVLVSLLAACGGAKESVPSVDSTATPSSSVSSMAPRVDSTQGAPRGACPATGKWALCSLETRLKRSGFVAKRLEEENVKRAGFSIEPTVYSLGRGRLEVFLYDDEAALASEMAKLDTVTVAPIGAAAAWPSPPSLVRNGNLAAVFMEQNARQAERLVLAITAGAPSAR